MFLEEVFRQINKDNSDFRVLDLCAAPGGKSTHLLSLISSKSLLVSNEVIPARNKILQQNIMKCGLANCIVTQNKSEDFARTTDFFDVILVDAPCSGEGLFRKDPEAVHEWSEKNVAMCSVRQKEILGNVVHSLKPGGHLIYSTCTYEAAENDEVIKWLCENFGLQLFKLELTEKFVGIKEADFGYQFLPHRIKGEGFYIAVLKKNGVAYNQQATAGSGAIKNKALAEYINLPSDFVEYQKDELIYIIPTSMFSDFNYIKNNFYIRQAGIFAGQLKGKDFLPSHDLALSVHLENELPNIELDYDNALRYLRGESLSSQSAERGWQLVRHKGFNLGWVKALQGRFNNYYPKELRILKRLDWPLRHRNIISII